MKELIKDVVLSLVVTTIILQFVKVSEVVGISMEPNFHTDDYLLVSKQAYRGKLPERGDVVTFDSDLIDLNGNDKLLIKRVIGLPGDHVVVKDGKVFVNDKELRENYIKEGYTNGEVDSVVPQNYVFCMGDNRLHSTDSRFPEVGMVSLKRIEGKVSFRIWPVSKFGRI